MSVLAVAITFSPGCRLISYGDDDNSAVTGGTTSSSLSGRIVKNTVPASIRKNAKSAIIAADVTGLVGVAGAEVWIEDLAVDPRFHTITDASGTYTFHDVPAGPHRIVTRYVDPGTQLTMKALSAELQVNDTPETVNAPDLAAEVARNIVTGVLRDAEGNFLPENTALSLWGETFYVGKEGAFTSWPLPDSYAEAEIQVTLPGGNGKTSFTAPFVSDVVPVFLELKVGSNPETGNHAPSVSLQARLNGELVSKVSPGAIVTLTAIGNDLDSGEQATLTPFWGLTAGAFSNGSSDFEKRWTAPDFSSLATISVEVKDAHGATGTAYLPILVGIDKPAQADTSRPTVALSCEVSSVIDSATFTVRVTFSEPVTGFSLEDVAVSNGTASALTTIIGQKVFTVKVTPQAAGELKVSVPEKVAQDLGGNNNTAGNTITVTNTIAAVLSSAKELTAFSLLSPQVVGVINPANKTVNLTVPFGTEVTSLVANFTVSANATVKVGAVAQISGTTANNFSSAVDYIVTAADDSTNKWKVTVTPAQPVLIAALNLTSLVTKPAKGAAPLTTAISATQYNSGAISWFESDGSTAVVGNFAALKVYVAKLALTANAGYTLTGVAANSFIYTGATSISNNADSGAVVITFPPTSLTMVNVPEGTFQRDATPANTSTVSAFRMSQHEITRTQFGTIMGTDPSNTTYSTGVTDPVQMTNWYHAIAFCNMLSIAEGLTQVYDVSGVDFSTLTYAAIPTSTNTDWNLATCNSSANGYRLPTEMEWMWAAMGADLDSQPGAMSGGVNVTGYAKTFAGYNGSNSLDAFAWYFSNSSSKTHLTGSKQANELGLYDLSGNVREWCWDWYSDNGTWPNYAISGVHSDYRGAGTGSYRVIRGGSWDFSADYVTVAYRGNYGPDDQGNDIGFRVVRP